MTGPSPIRLMILRGPEQRGQTRGGFVHFLNQPRPRAPAGVRELLAVDLIVLAPRLRVGWMSGR